MERPAAIEAPAPSWGRRLTGIEGLRALAALSVLAGHAIIHAPSRANLGVLDKWVVPNLTSGLILFFTLSGFLLYRPFAASIVRAEALPSARAYLRNRVLRIVPAYWVILLAVALLLGAATLTPEPRHIGYLTDPRVLGADLLLVQDYAPTTVITGISPAWSLSVEAAFYLCLPLLALFGARLAAGRGWAGRTVAALVPAAVLLVVGPLGDALARSIPVASGSDPLWGASWRAVVERSFLAHADLFAFGMAAAVMVACAADGRVRLPAGVTRIAGLGALACASAAVVLRTETVYDGDRLLAFASALLILWAVLPRERPSVLIAVLESRAAVWFGVVSYSVYLWHEPLVMFLGRHGLMARGAAGVVLNVALVLAITSALSALTYRFVEAPAMRRKARVAAPTAAGRG